MTVPPLTRSLLRRPARFAARSVGQTYLQRVLDEAHRVEVLGNSTESKRPEGLGELRVDPEGVHDLRIALRRLRTWLRCWRPFLQDTVEEGSERRLQRISRSAGRTRDLEVAHDWLNDSALRRTLPARTTSDRLARGVAGEHGRALGQLARLLEAELPPAAAEVVRELRDYHVEGDSRHPEPNQRTAIALAALLEEHATRLGRTLGRVRHVRQVQAAHKARIAVKRLRYLLDALEPPSPAVGAAVKQLARFQRLLGDLHDLQLLARRLATQPRAGPPGAPAPPGIGALRALLRRRTAAQFREVRRSVRGNAVSDVIETAERLARRLRKELLR